MVVENQPDIMVFCNQRKKAVMIDAAILSDSNIREKELGEHEKCLNTNISATTTIITAYFICFIPIYFET